MAPPPAGPAPASGPEAERRRRPCGPIWILCPGYPARGRRALEAAVAERTAMDAGTRARRSREVPALGGCTPPGTKDACVGKGHPATSVRTCSRCGWSNLLLSGRQKEQKPPSNHTKLRGLQVPKYYTHSSPHVYSRLFPPESHSGPPNCTAGRVLGNGSSQSHHLTQGDSLAQPLS